MNEAIVGGYGTDLNAIVSRAAAGRWRTGLWGNTSAFDAPAGVPYIPSLSEASQVAHLIYADLAGRVLPAPMVVHLWITIGLTLVGVAAWRMALSVGVSGGLALATGVLCQVLPQTLWISSYQATYAHSWVPLLTVVAFVHAIRKPSRRRYLTFTGCLLLCALFEYYWVVFSLVPITALLLARTLAARSMAIKLVVVAAVVIGFGTFHVFMVNLIDNLAARRNGLGFPNALTRLYGPEFFIPHSQLITPPADHVVGPLIRALPGNAQWSFNGGFWIGGLTLALIPFGIRHFLASRATRWFLAVALTYLLVTIPPFYIEVAGKTIFMPSGWFAGSFPRFRAPYRAVLIWAPMAIVIAVAGLQNLGQRPAANSRRLRKKVLHPALIIPLMIVDIVGMNFRATIDPDSIVFSRVNAVLRNDGAQRILSPTPRVYGFENIIGGRDSTIRNLNYHAQFGVDVLNNYLIANGVTHVVTASPTITLYPGQPWFSPTVDLRFDQLGASLVERVDWFQGGSPEQETLFVDIWRLTKTSQTGKILCRDCGGLYVDTDGPTASVSTSGVVPRTSEIDIVWEDKLRVKERRWLLILQIRRTDGLDQSTVQVTSDGKSVTESIGSTPIEVSLSVPRSGRARVSVSGMCRECFVVERVNFIDE